MLKIRVFCHRTAMCLRILAVRAVRTVFLLKFLQYQEEQWKGGLNPNRSLGRICLDLLLPSCFLTALVRLPASALPFHLDVARYAFDETSAHLLNNRTKSVKDSNDQFGFNLNRSIERSAFLYQRKKLLLLTGLGLCRI